MKNNKNLVPYKVQDDVTLYFENQLMDKILDIDVKPGVKRVRLSGPLPNTRRAERHVALRAGKCVKHILVTAAAMRIFSI